MDVLYRMKYQRPFGVDQMSQWMFWTGPNLLQGNGKNPVSSQQEKERINQTVQGQLAIHLE